MTEEADKLRQTKHHDAPTVQRQVAAMENRWQRFLARMEEHRTLLEASIEFHQLYEQVPYAHVPYTVHHVKQKHKKKGSLSINALRA